MSLMMRTLLLQQKTLRSCALPKRLRAFHTGRIVYSSSEVVRALRQKFNDKKLEHLQLAERDDAVILSLSGRVEQLTSRKHYGLERPQDLKDHNQQPVYGLGVTPPSEVFINNELNLRQIEVYGFDYDAKNLARTIYDILKDILVDMLRYPKQIKDMQFDPTFAIRGLHFDFNKGWLMKIDSYANIQLNTIAELMERLLVEGRERVKDLEEVIRHYHGTHISPGYLASSMFQLNDLFSVPQACLLSDVLQYFKDNNISFHPRYLCDDVNQAARVLHIGTDINGALGVGGRLHMAIMDDTSHYLEASPKLVGFLERLRKNGKKTDEGMSYLTSTSDWRDLFDVVVTSSRKPDFYRSRRPFRRAREPTWRTVDRFEPGEIYQGGNLGDFTRMTGWVSFIIMIGVHLHLQMGRQKVLYFGDHIFSDLIDPTIEQGWRTGAIVHELNAEIDTRNTTSYRHTLAWLIRIEGLLNEAQGHYGEPDIEGLDTLIDEWREMRRQARYELRNVFNSSFGSVFRTYQNPTYFANKIRQFADIYMSNVTNLDHIPLDYIFYPDRTYLPHERLVESLIDTGRIKELLMQQN
ncbi:5' nucleotidase family-domain-containing protein [Dichotomocladium elegans]|nr:5' nucleotidase family-domain-containing protein [Dichotomocladium elegans]